MTRPLVTVIIVTRNRRDDLREAIFSVKDQTHPNIEILVIDNASEDDTIEMVECTFPDVVLIRESSNTGPYAARNRGIASAHGEILYFLDDDGTLDADALAQSVSLMRRDERIGVVVSKTIDVQTGSLAWDFVSRTDSDLEQPVLLGDLVSEGAVAIRRCVFEDVGLWPAHYFRQSVGREMGLRVLDAGYDMCYCPQAVMYHKNSPLGGMNRDLIQKEKHFYKVRNELWIAWTYLPVARAIIETAIKLIYYPGASLRTGALSCCLRGMAAAFKALPGIVRHERSPVRPETLAKRDRLLYLGAACTRDDPEKITALNSRWMLIRRAHRLMRQIVGRHRPVNVRRR